MNDAPHAAEHEFDAPVGDTYFYLCRHAPHEEPSAHRADMRVPGEEPGLPPAELLPGFPAAELSDERAARIGPEG